MHLCVTVVSVYFTCSDACHAQQIGRGKIAFYSTRDGREDIYVVDADGTNLRRLTDGNAGGLCPTFSPDGRQIAFLSRRDGNEEIYVMDVGGRNVRRLTVLPATHVHPRHRR
jgi:TolB protein